MHICIYIHIYIHIPPKRFGIPPDQNSERSVADLFPNLPGFCSRLEWSQRFRAPANLAFSSFQTQKTRKFRSTIVIMSYNIESNLFFSLVFVNKTFRKIEGLKQYKGYKSLWLQAKIFSFESGKYRIGFCDSLDGNLYSIMETTILSNRVDIRTKMHSSGEVLTISGHLQHFPADAGQIIKHNATLVQNLNAAGAELTSNLMPHTSLENASHIVRAKKLEQTVPAHILSPSRSPALETIRKELVKTLSLSTPLFDPKSLLNRFIKDTSRRFFRTMWVFRKTSQASVKVQVLTEHMSRIYIPYFAVSGVRLIKGNQEGVFEATIYDKIVLQTLLTDPSYQNNWFNPCEKAVFTTDVQAFNLQKQAQKITASIPLNPLKATKQEVVDAAKVELKAEYRPEMSSWPTARLGQTIVKPPLEKLWYREKSSQNRNFLVFQETQCQFLL